MRTSQCVPSCRGWGRLPPQAGGIRSAFRRGSCREGSVAAGQQGRGLHTLSLIHISEPTRLALI
eukprot:11623241-Alexandrium_andersonii.AAC.1